MTELDALWAAVGANPGERLPRMVLADWLDEREAEAECGECGPPHKWWPACPNCHGSGRVSNGYSDTAAALRATVDRVPLGDGDYWPGWFGGTGAAASVHPPSNLVRHLFDRLEQEKHEWDTVEPNGSFRFYPTAEAAIRDLCRAWVQVHRRGVTA